MVPSLRIVPDERARRRGRCEIPQRRDEVFPLCGGQKALEVADVRRADKLEQHLRDAAELRQFIKGEGKRTVCEGEAEITAL